MMQEQQLADQMYDHDQFLIVEHLNNLEARQQMLRREWENEIRTFNKALVGRSNVFYSRFVSRLIFRLIKNDVNKISNTRMKIYSLKLKYLGKRLCFSVHH